MDITDFIAPNPNPDPHSRYFYTNVVTQDWADPSSSPLADIKAAIARYEDCQGYSPTVLVTSQAVYNRILLLQRTTRIDIYWDMALFPRTTRLTHRIRRARSRLHYRYLDWKHRNDPGYF